MSFRLLVCDDVLDCVVEFVVIAVDRSVLLRLIMMSVSPFSIVSTVVVVDVATGVW